MARELGHTKGCFWGAECRRGSDNAGSTTVIAWRAGITLTEPVACADADGGIPSSWCPAALAGLLAPIGSVSVGFKREDE